MMNSFLYLGQFARKSIISAVSQFKSFHFKNSSRNIQISQKALKCTNCKLRLVIENGTKLQDHIKIFGTYMVE